MCIAVAILFDSSFILIRPILYLHNPGIPSVCQDSITHSLTHSPTLHQHHNQQSQCLLDITNSKQTPHMALVLLLPIVPTDPNHRQHQTTPNEYPPPPTPRPPHHLHTHLLPTRTTPNPGTQWINNNNHKSSSSAAQDVQNA
jgi:hypothetical protein